MSAPAKRSPPCTGSRDVAELADVNPYIYLVNVIDKIAAGWSAGRVTELHPRAWLAARQAEQSPPGQLRRRRHVMRDHFHVKLAPPSLLHGTIHVRCEVGWGTTPLVPEHTSMRQLFAWQKVTGYGPFEVTLP